MARRLTPEEKLLRTISEEQWQDKVCAMASWLHWSWWHDNDSRRNKAGLPDLLVWGYGQFFMVELKKETGKLSPMQESQITALRAASVEVHVWRPSDSPEVEARLRRRQLESSSVPPGSLLRAEPRARRQYRRPLPR